MTDDIAFRLTDVKWWNGPVTVRTWEVDGKWRGEAWIASEPLGPYGVVLKEAFASHGHSEERAKNDLRDNISEWRSCQERIYRERRARREAKVEVWE